MSKVTKTYESTLGPDNRFALAEKLEQPAVLQERIAAGSVTVVNPQTMPSEMRQRSEQGPLSTLAPLYVIKQLRQRHAETGETIRNQILRALQKDGIEVHEHDLRDERKRRPW
jgi:hypothetical protein